MQISLGGFPSKLRMINFGEYEYLLATTRDKELFSVLNVTDIHNSSLLAKYVEDIEQGYDIDFSSDNKYLYILTTKGLRVLPVLFIFI